MKKLILFVMICIPTALVAQNGVTISNLVVNSGTVTLNVSWKNTGMPTPWSDTVWVWVDYKKNSKMERLPLSPGATLTATSAPGVGKVITASGNNEGVWVVGNARSAGSFSASVKLLTALTDLTGVCAYASNYPPAGKYTSATNISFTGTPLYNIVIKKNIDGTTITQELDSPFTVPQGYTVQSFTDKTGAPGRLVPATYTLSGAGGCAGANITLTLSGSQYGWRYQLYRDATAIGHVVDGTGSALIFNDASGTDGSFNYTVWTVDNPAVEAQRALQVSDVRAITVNATPSNLTLTTNPETICSGQTVALTATASTGTTSAMTYTWNIGGTSHTTTVNTTRSQTLTASTTCTVRVANANGCGTVSAPATITVLPRPTITLKGGAVSQSVKLGTSMTPIVYTESNGMTISRASGSFPPDVSGSATGSSYTISGKLPMTVVAPYTYGYRLTAGAGACSTTVAGTITVTWTKGDWSDPVKVSPPGCNFLYRSADLENVGTGDRAYTVGEYMDELRYYYTWTCVYNAHPQLCPSPWAMPAAGAFYYLIDETAATWQPLGFISGNSYINRENLYLWAHTHVGNLSDGTEARYYSYVKNVGGRNTESFPRNYMMQVRCVIQ